MTPDGAINGQKFKENDYQNDEFFSVLSSASAHAKVNWEKARRSENVEDFRDTKVTGKEWGDWYRWSKGVLNDEQRAMAKAWHEEMQNSKTMAPIPKDRGGIFKGVNDLRDIQLGFKAYADAIDEDQLKRDFEVVYRSMEQFNKKGK